MLKRGEQSIVEELDKDLLVSELDGEERGGEVHGVLGLLPPVLFLLAMMA